MMAGGKKKENALMPEEKLVQALVPEWEWPYKLPENWCWVYLPSVCDYMRAGGDKPRVFSEERTAEAKVPVVANGIQNEGIIGFTDNENEKVGTVTVSGRGTIGYPILREYPYYPVVRLIVLAPNKAILPSYLKNVFFYLEEKGTGSSIPQLTVPMLKGKPIPIAPLNEQQRIVERIDYLFSKLDEAKEKAQSVLDSFETRKAAILHKAFSGELTAKWRVEHGQNLEMWQQKRFDEVAEIKSNLVDPLDYQDFPHIAPDNIEKKSGVLLEYHTIAEDGVKSGKHRFYPGQILYSKIRPYLSKVVVVDFDGLCSADMYPIEANQDARCLWYYMLSEEFLEQASSVGSRSVLPKINQKELSAVSVCLPDTMDEQREIVRILDSLFAKERQAKEAAEAVREKIDLLKKSILARAFRGELGTNDPTEASAIELLKEVLQQDSTPAPRKRTKSMPKELQAKLSTALERKIIKLYFQQETDSLPAGELLSVSTKKFEIMETLHDLEQCGIVKKLPNGRYNLLW